MVKQQTVIAQGFQHTLHRCCSHTRTVLVDATVLVIYFTSLEMEAQTKANLPRCHIRIIMEEALETQSLLFLNLQ